MQRLLNDVTTIEEAGAKESSKGDEADALPLLQHALNRTWRAFDEERSTNPTASQLLLKHYTQVGGIEEALSRHLDEAWGCGRTTLGKDAADRITARVFQRLRARDLKGREARDPVRFGELVEIVGAPAPQVKTVLDCFRDAGRPFLTPRLAVRELATAPKASDSTEHLGPDTDIDITHECLLRRWKQLKTVWAPQEEDSRRMYLRLAQFLDEQERVTGDWLRIATSWWERTQPTEAWAKRYDPRFTEIRDWFETSKKRAADETRQAARRAATMTWLKAGIGIFCIAAVIAVLFIRSLMIAQRTGTYNWQLAVTQLLSARAQTAFLDPAIPRRTSAMLAAASLKYSADLGMPLPNESRSVLASALPWIPRMLPIIHSDQPVNTVVASDDGKLLVIVGRGGAVMVERDGQPSQRFTVMSDADDVTLSRDNHYIVVSRRNESGAVEVWDLVTGTRVANVSCPSTGTDYLNAVTGPAILNPDSSVLFAPCVGSVVQWTRDTWHAGTGTRLKLSEPVLSPIVALAFDADGDHLAFAGEAALGAEDFILVQEVVSGKLARSYRAGVAADLTMIRFLSDGGMAAADTAGVVHVWQQHEDVGDQVPNDHGHLAADPPVFLTHGRPVIALSPSSNGKLLLTVTSDGTTRLWETGGEEQWRQTIGRRAITATFDWATHRLVIADGGQDVTQRRLWETSDRQVLPLGTKVITRRNFAGDAFFHFHSGPRPGPDGTRLAGVAELVVFNPDGTTQPVDVDDANAAAFSEDGRRFATVQNGRTELFVYARDAQNHFNVESRAPLAVLGQSVGLLGFSPDGKFVVVSLGALATLRGGRVFAMLYNVERRATESVKSVTLPLRTISQVTNDGHVLTRDMRGNVFDWDLRSGRTRPIPMAGDAKGGGMPVASHDGALLAVYGSTAGAQASTGGSELKLVQRSDLSVARSWRYEGAISRLAFSGDDQFLVGASADAPLRVWNTATGEEVVRVQSPELPVQMKFSADRRQILVLGNTMLWRFLWSTNDLLTELCARKALSLTDSEWSRFIDQPFRKNLEPYRCVCPCQ
jgi:WD40 repeat protein